MSDADILQHQKVHDIETNERSVSNIFSLICELGDYFEVIEINWFLSWVSQLFPLVVTVSTLPRVVLVLYINSVSCYEGKG